MFSVWRSPGLVLTLIIYVSLVRLTHWTRYLLCLEKQRRSFRIELVPSPPPTFPKEWLKQFWGFSSAAVETIETEAWIWGQPPSFKAEALLVLCFIYHFYISLPRRMGSMAKHTQKCLNHRPSGFWNEEIITTNNHGLTHAWQTLHLPNVLLYMFSFKRRKLKPRKGR